MIRSLECERGCFKQHDMCLFISRSDKHLKTSLGQQTWDMKAQLQRSRRDGCTWQRSGTRRGTIWTQTHWSEPLLPNAIISMWPSSLRTALSLSQTALFLQKQTKSAYNKTTRITLKQTLSIKWLTLHESFTSESQNNKFQNNTRPNKLLIRYLLI